MIVFRKFVRDNVMNTQGIVLVLTFVFCVYDAASGTLEAVSLPNRLRKLFPTKHFMSATNSTTSPFMMIFTNLSFAHNVKSFRLSLAPFFVALPLCFYSLATPSWFNVKFFQMTHYSAMIYTKSFANLSVGLTLKHIKAYQGSVKRLAYSFANFICACLLVAFLRTIHGWIFRGSGASFRSIANRAIHIKILRHVNLLVEGSGRIIRGQARYQFFKSS